MPPPSPLDDEIRALYQGPLAEFIAARQALAKRLKKEGDAREAEVRALAKASVSAWAVNQLFAHEARAMAAFVGAGERARAAQRRAAGGDPEALREALALIRNETPRLTARAVELVTAADRAPGEAIVERLRTNLDALALDPAVAAVASRGWLDEDLAPPGFEVMAALQVAAAGTRPATPARREAEPAAAAPASRGGKGATVHSIDKGREVVAARKEREGRERRERDRGEEIARLEAELARAEKEAAAKQKAAKEAAEASERAAREAVDANRRAVDSRTNAREARELAVRAEAQVSRAREALSRAERS